MSLHDTTADTFSKLKGCVYNVFILLYLSPSGNVLPAKVNDFMTVRSSMIPRSKNVSRVPQQKWYHCELSYQRTQKT